MVPDAARWSVYVGVYTFLAGAGLLVPLGVIANTLVEILGLPTGLTTILMPGTGAIIGAVVWWAVVERRSTYTYLIGGAAGLLTVLLTVILWSLFLAVIYGPGMILAAGAVIAFVLVLVAPVGFIAWLLLMYARRHLIGGQSCGTEPVLE